MRKSNFGLMPSVKFNRSKFPMNHNVHTTCNVGELVPLDCIEVLPGDSWKSLITNVSRVSTAFLKPVMDNLWFDTYTFFVPLRLVYDNAEKVFGNPSPSAYVETDFAEMPSNAEEMTIYSKSVADYLGLPVGATFGAGEINVLQHRAFALIYEQWFRNENVIDEMYIQKGEAVSSETCNENEWSANNYFGKLPKVGKRKDYFTSGVPRPQKGEAIDLVKGGRLSVVYDKASPTWTTITDTGVKLNLNKYLGGISNGQTAIPNKGLGEAYFRTMETNSFNPGQSEVPSYTFLYPTPENAQAIFNLDINDLRFQNALQRMLEIDATYGTRYNEYLLGHFGVYSPDARLQFAECLGGGRFPISIQQVAQTSQGTEDSPQANVAGFSWSNGQCRYSKGFTEHGYLITVGCIRQMHSYSQGVPKQFLRKTREDIYDPTMANLGFQPIYTSELFVKTDGTPNINLKDSVFNYNEAWLDYKSLPNKITGQMRSNIDNSLDIWHFGDNYATQPFFTKNFVEETPVYVDRTLAVNHEAQDQFIIDLYFKSEAIRVMPVYSSPSLEAYK